MAKKYTQSYYTVQTNKSYKFEIFVVLKNEILINLTWHDLIQQ